MENQITLVERGTFDDLKELERLWETDHFKILHVHDVSVGEWTGPLLIAALYVAIIIISLQSSEQEPPQSAVRATVPEERSTDPTVSLKNFFFAWLEDCKKERLQVIDFFFYLFAHLKIFLLSMS